MLKTLKVKKTSRKLNVINEYVNIYITYIILKLKIKKCNLKIYRENNI